MQSNYPITTSDAPDKLETGQLVSLSPEDRALIRAAGDAFFRDEPEDQNSEQVRETCVLLAVHAQGRREEAAARRRKPAVARILAALAG
jgi:hypothetical protein